VKLVTWNVNGIRACTKKGFLSWFQEEDADFVCLQEVKALEEQVDPAVLAPEGYSVTWNAAEKKGYSGVATYSRHEPVKSWRGLGIERFDREGRLIATDLGAFVLFNIYFPKGTIGTPRMEYKLSFYESLLSHLTALRREGRSVIVCGDWNTAHREIDLARPAQNRKTSGFLDEEREWIDRYLAAGYVDAFRDHEEGDGHYSWWSYRAGARGRNVGWRLDYFLVSEDLRHSVDAAFIRRDVEGSDHCPVGIELDISL